MVAYSAANVLVNSTQKTMPRSFKQEEVVTQLVHTAVEAWSSGFKGRHEGERNDPEGTINMKIHNVFIAALGPEIQYYTALVRSLDSSLGNMLEQLAISIAKLNYQVEQEVSGTLGVAQTEGIARLLESYKRSEGRQTPSSSDYQFLRTRPSGQITTKRHDSDYYLVDRETGDSFLIELKIGGDLDNKKARSEKEALLEQFAILSNKIGSPNKKMKIFFATAYNRYGEDKPWNQTRVKQFFATDELLIGRDFWNFVCKDPNGYSTVIGAYKQKAPVIRKALDAVKDMYLS